MKDIDIASLNASLQVIAQRYSAVQHHAMENTNHIGRVQAQVYRLEDMLRELILRVERIEDRLSRDPR